MADSTADPGSAQAQPSRGAHYLEALLARSKLTPPWRPRERYRPLLAQAMRKALMGRLTGPVIRAAKEVIRTDADFEPTRPAANRDLRK